MAIKYNTPKSVLPADWSYEKDPHYYEYWVDFKEKALQGQWADALNGKFNARFGEFTKDWTVDDFRNWAESSGLTESIKKGLPSDYSLWTNLLASGDIGGIQRVIGALVMDKYGHFTDAKYETSASDIASVVDGMRSYNAQKELVSNLKEKGGTDEQIQAILDSRDGSADSYTSLYDEIENLSGDEWNNYVNENFADEGILPDGTFGEYTIPKNIQAGANELPPEEVIQQASDTLLTGDPTNPDRLTPVDGSDTEFTDAEGNTVYLKDGRYVYGDGKPYISPDQTTVVRETQEAQAAAGEARDDLIAATQDYQDWAAATTGGEVTTGVAQALGWTRTADGWRDKEGNEYTVDPDTGLLMDGDTVVRTQGTLNSAENDFAQQFTDAANEFLYGSAITPENAEASGFTKDGLDYIGPDGRRYSVQNNTLVDAEGTALRFDGFRDYENQMKNANATYQSEMETLKTSYGTAYDSYVSELSPYRTQMDEITEDLRGIAEQAGDTNYYNRLSNLYYAEASDEIDRQTAGAQETLKESYANAGLDPSSPAYTQAIMDLQNKRSDASRSARRQAILDSYSLGTQMLTNQTNALSNAQTGIGRSMDALSDLYDVKLEGLGVEKDMISTIYAGKIDAAQAGLKGLDTRASLEREKINANQNSYFKNLDITSGVKSSTINTMNNLYGTMQNATNTGMDRMQNYSDSTFDWMAAGAAIKTQFPDFDTSTLDERLQEKFGFK